MNSQQIAYVNGEFLPESEAKISINDRGFIYGDAVFDTARTFNGKIFFLDDHIDRLFESCKYLDINPLLSKEEYIKLTHEILEKNVAFLQENEDYWVTQRVTRGIRAGDSNQDNSSIQSTIIMNCRKIIFRKRAPYFKDGVPLSVSSYRRIPPWAVSPRAKTHNYLNMVLAENEVQSHSPSAWAVLLDENGNLCEGLGCNIFVVKNGVLYTPPDIYTLGGITRKVVMDLARSVDIPLIVKDLDPYDAIIADEIFLTSTSLCVCPAISFNGTTIGTGNIPGPITKRLQEAFNSVINMDFVKQYLYFYSDGPASPF